MNPSGRYFRVGVLTCLVLSGVATHPTASVQVSAPPLHRVWDLRVDGGDPIRVSQNLVPLRVRGKPHKNLTLMLDAAYSSSQLRETGQPTLKLEGFSSPSIGFEWRRPGGSLAILPAVSLPLGDPRLTPDEQNVARLLALPTLGFPVRQVERGLTAGLGLSREFRMGEGARTSIGLGGTYRGSYVAVEGGESYRPASELAATLGLDLGRTESSFQLRMDATYRIFGADQLRDSTILEEGDQVELHLLSLFPGDVWNAQLEVRGTIKAANRSPDPSATATNVFRWYSGDGLLIRAGTSREIGARSRLGLQAEFLHVAGSAQTIRNGSTYAAGPWARLGLGGGVAVGADAAYLKGRMDSPGGGRIDAHGLHLSVGLMLGGE